MAIPSKRLCTESAMTTITLRREASTVAALVPPPAPAPAWCPLSLVSAWYAVLSRPAPAAARWAWPGPANIL